MARKKNPNPTKRPSSYRAAAPAPKRQRVQGPAGRSTTVIQADSSNDSRDILSLIETFAQQFQAETFGHLQDDYAKAKASNGQNLLDQNGWYRDYRMINGNRYEIRILGAFMKEKFGNSFPQQLVDYAQRQAQKDERVQQMKDCPGSRLSFTEWSMIVSEECEEQSIHIDVPETNVQFGLVLTSNNPGTKVLLDEQLGPYSVQQLFLCWADAPQALQDCVVSNPHIESRILNILKAYGPLLRSRGELESSMVGAETLTSASLLKCGDLICTSGGIPHAGPACPCFRAVMFAAASASTHDLYNVDDQYVAHSAVLFVIQAIWDAANVEGDTVDPASVKTWLLQRLADTVFSYESSLVENHRYVSHLFTDFMAQVAAVKKRKDREKQVAAIVNNFLKDNGSKSERDLFQYRPPGIYDHEV